MCHGGLRKYRTRVFSVAGCKDRARALFAAPACVGKDTLVDMVVEGGPARVLGKASAIELRDNFGRPAYPLKKHLTRGFPDEITKSRSSCGEKQA